jgi:alpha-glucosidase (family GH31 glycosyl hydrolase)
MLPEWASGFWQCKLRYRTQDELLDVRQIPAGLNIGLSGIPWWTTDIGGFKGGTSTRRRSAS